MSEPIPLKPGSGDDVAAELFSTLRAGFGDVPAGFLDSSDHAVTPRPQRSRYSILTFSSGDHAEVHSSDDDGFTQLSRVWRTHSQAQLTQQDQQKQHAQQPPRPQWVGYIGYQGQSQLFRVTHSAVIDHHQGLIHLRSTDDLRVWARLVHSALERAQPIDPAMASVQTLNCRWLDSALQYQAKIAAAQEQIRQGMSYEICLTTAVTAQLCGDPWLMYVTLRAANRAPFTQFLSFPDPTGSGADVVVASTSPERFVSLSPSGKLCSEPIKGTRRRSPDPDVDAAFARDLAHHPKDRAENVMIADLVRNDLSRFAMPGTLRTERLCAVESYPSVHQLVSTITAQLSDLGQRAAALEAAFPPGSMTGAPKHSTMRILKSLESAPRRLYSGVAGFFGDDGACDLSVLIRTAVLTRAHPGAENHGDLVSAQESAPQSDPKWSANAGLPSWSAGHQLWSLHLGVGGAITADSDPKAEWEEVVIKASGVLNALGVASGA